MADPEPDDDLEDIRAVIAFLKEHAAELREKGVPIDDMIRNLERQIEVVRSAAQKARDLKAQDQEFEREKVDRRRELGEIIASLPPSLADGMPTLEYLMGIAEKEASRIRRGKKGMGG